MDLIVPTDRGLYCPPGDFYIDPWQPVDRAVVTHAHADHARAGSARYLTAEAGRQVLRQRLGESTTIDTLPYGHALEINGTRLSLHPAGHILGSAQVRIEHRGQVAVVSGDYKREADATCAPFEVVPCHLFLTESTFGLPIYRWPSANRVNEQINAWWRQHAAMERPCVLFGYALGKAQRILAGLDASLGPIVTHGAVEALVRAYRASGVVLPPTRLVSEVEDRTELRRAMVLAPPSAQGSPWMRRFANATTGFASGWMRIRGARRRRAFDRGFVLSDHVDWPALVQTIEETGAEEVWVTHGYSATVARWLADRGVEARVVQTHFKGESLDEPPAETGEPAANDVVASEPLDPLAP